MRLASFVADGRERFGIVKDDGLIDLTRHIDAPSLRHALASGAGAVKPYGREDVDWAFDQVQWLPTIPNPVHIVALGLNTKSHFEETAELMNRIPGDYPRYPRLFMRSPLSLVGHEQPILRPHVSSRLDYEGEIAIVIGSSCRYVAVEDALGVVAGVTCANDGSIRDFQRHTDQVTAGKNFPGSGALGPWMTTVDEIGNFDRLRLDVRVNGEARQRSTADDLIFSFAEMISYMSKVFALQPGDVILAGSPAGVGALSNTWLAPGDEIEVEVSGVGVLRNSVENEEPGKYTEQVS